MAKVGWRRQGRATDFSPLRHTVAEDGVYHTHPAVAVNLDLDVGARLHLANHLGEMRRRHDLRALDSQDQIFRTQSRPFGGAVGMNFQHDSVASKPVIQVNPEPGAAAWSDDWFRIDRIDRSAAGL